MQELANRIKSAAGLSGGLLVGQMLFAVAFVSACEVPNFMSAAPQKNACLERWMAVSALFIPSGLSKGSAPLPVPAKTEPLVTPRRAARRTTTKTTTTKKP
jgi:hypothetical protein